MIIPAYALTATERVLPRMALDFTTALLDSRVTVTRALNTATRINSSGVIETVNADLPRFDYTLGSGGACKGLLIEEARTNSLTGVDLVNPTVTTGWTGFGNANAVFSVVSDDAALSAAGLSGLCSTGKVFKLDNSTGTTPYYVRVDNSLTLGTGSWAFSLYARGSGTFSIDVNAGTWTGSTTPAISSVYQRISSVGTSSVSSNQHRVSISAGGVVYFILNQAEAGGFVTSVIPNTGSVVTRNSDVVSMTGTNFSDWYNATEGTFVATATPLAIGSYDIFSATNGSFNNRIQVPVANNVQYLVGDGGNIQAFLDAGTLTANAQTRVAVSYKTGLFALALNGSSSTLIASGTVPTVNRLDIGNLAGFAEFFNGHISSLRYYPQSLISAELLAFSK